VNPGPTNPMSVLRQLLNADGLLFRMETVVLILVSQITFWSSSIISKNASRSISIFCSPSPTSTVLVSSGFRVDIKVAIWLEYKCPRVSLCSPPAPIIVFGLRWPNGSMSSPMAGSAVSNDVGEADERGTWIYRKLVLDDQA